MTNTSPKNQSRIETYLTATLGAGCIAAPANAAITVESFGAGTQNATLAGGGALMIFGDPFTTPPDYGGYYFNSGATGRFGSIGGTLAFRSANSPSAGDIDGFNNFFEYNYNLPAGVVTGVGAELGINNYVFFDQNSDGTYETLLHFDLDGERGGVLLGAAVENTPGASINYSDGVTALNVPEPSSLGLLSLGAAGLVIRRKRKTALSR